MTDKMEAPALAEFLTERTLKYLQPWSPLITSIDKVRVAAETGRQLPTAWPLDSVYVTTDALISIYTQIKHMMAAEKGETLDETEDSPEMMDKYVVEPSILSVLLPWVKTRSFVHLNNPQLSDDILNNSSAIFTKLPQWTTFFDLSGQNFEWDGHQIQAVGFARYFFGLNKAIGHEEECPVTVENEPKSFVNNMTCIFLDTNGDFILGPLVPINDKFTIEQMAAHGTQVVIDSLSNEFASGNMTQEQLESLKDIANETLALTKSIFKILTYFLLNQDKIKDAAGNPVSLVANPKTESTPTGAQIKAAEQTTIYYLD